MSSDEREVLERQALDLFGELLMRKVRDKQIRLWDQTISGEIRSSTYRDIHRKLKESYGPEQMVVLRKLLPWVVDNTIAYFLGMLEEAREEVAVAVQVGGQTVPSLGNVLDGLATQLYSEDGWEAQFSQEALTDVGFFTEDVTQS